MLAIVWKSTVSNGRWMTALAASRALARQQAYVLGGSNSG
ncbi:hypothetical protein TIFTF001_007340 [Ficus carica]|uniref:Uncharacterized protein n=1 Tax=Ficus carica TaxID=3494 RepID=A0AA88DGF2_FICCA|nr:hypothetical protein TIFTF001_007340 [Ficus carica]